MHPDAGTDHWLEQVTEDIVDPDLPIIDPHHHLWRRGFGREYLLDDLWRDTGSGHKVVATVFVECHAEYRRQGPDHLKPLGETEFVTGQAKQSDADKNQATIAGIVGSADLMAHDTVGDVLDAHSEIAEGRFCGIRQAGAHARAPEDLFIAGRQIPDLYAREDFRKGLKVLAEKGLTYDTWHYHYQNQDFLALAQACPDTQMVLDHFGTPLGVGEYAGQREQIFQQWRKDMADIARCPNVVAKLGGMAMPDNGFGWHDRDTPATSDEFAAAQAPYYLHMIECFGVDRCMMESNFPVDRFSISYPVLYNGLKKIVADFTRDERRALFHDTAARVYSLNL